MGLFGFGRHKPSAPSSVFKERRMLPRWSIYARAKIRLTDKNAYVDCEVKNLNLRGFCVVSSLKIPECCPALTLYFNELFFFTVETSMAWHKESDGKQSYGLRFAKIKDIDKEKIYQMMRQDYSQHLHKYK